MVTRFYRSTVVGCAVAWFMVGLHSPSLHQMTSHGRELPAAVLVVVAALALAGVATLWMLLRLPATARASSDRGASARRG